VRTTGSVAAFALGLALAGCAAPDSGSASAEERPVGDFHSIQLRGAAQLDVLVGPAPSLTVTANSNARAAFTSHVEGGSLILESRNRFWQPQLGRVQARITVPQLQAIAVEGAGEITVNGASGAELALTLNGAANLEASGKVGSVTANMNGAGNMDLSHLESESATVTVNGAGNMDVFATRTLVATVNGVGSVTYEGQPADVKTAINGVGSIKPRKHPT
jgi:hypothetical protein